MIHEGLRVAVPLKDKTLGVVALEVQLILQSPGVFSAHQVRAFRGEMVKLVKLAIMDVESGDTLKFAHCSYLLLLPQDVGYLAAPLHAFSFGECYAAREDASVGRFPSRARRSMRRAAAFSSCARSRMAARSSSVNPFDALPIAVVRLADFCVPFFAGLFSAISVC
jgi:hypothetical protein